MATLSEVVKELRQRVKDAGNNQTVVAKELGVTLQYLSDVLHNRRAPGPKILRALGMRKAVRYERSGS